MNKTKRPITDRLAPEEADTAEEQRAFYRAMEDAADDRPDPSEF